ncbi:MAG: papain-like cysteine protease family protein [bacterium]
MRKGIAALCIFLMAAAASHSQWNARDRLDPREQAEQLSSWQQLDSGEAQQSSVPLAKLVYVGIDKSRWRYFEDTQHKWNWCWSACIQMVLNYSGVRISQEEIVARVKGFDASGPVNEGGAWCEMTGALNNWMIDSLGRSHTIQTSVFEGVPNAKVLVEELRNNRPVVVSHQEKETRHAVVVTGVAYVQDPLQPIVRFLEVYDPWPAEVRTGNDAWPTAGVSEPVGRRVHDIGWAGEIRHYWFVRVSN